jgi:hypothetical protein
MDSLQIAGFVGAMLILFAYVSHQLKKIDPEAPLYNALNACGAAVLTYIAFHPFQAGFVILEGTWTLVSIAAFFKALQRTRKPVTG